MWFLLHVHDYGIHASGLILLSRAVRRSRAAPKESGTLLPVIKGGFWYESVMYILVLFAKGPLSSRFLLVSTLYSVSHIHVIPVMRITGSGIDLHHTLYPELYGNRSSDAITQVRAFGLGPTKEFKLCHAESVKTQAK